MADIKLGIVGEAMVKKISQTKKKLSSEQISYLESQGYSPRGVGYINVSTGKFVSDIEIQQVLQTMPSDKIAEPINIPKNSINRKTTQDADPVYNVVKSISESINQFVDLIIERPSAKAVTPTAAAVPELGLKQTEQSTKSIFDKILNLGVGLALFGATVLLPLLDTIKATFSLIIDFAKTAFTTVKDSIVSFFTITVSDFFEDVKDFFTVDIPFKLTQLVDTLTSTVKSLLDVAGKIVDSIKEYGLKLTKNVVDKFSPWLEAVGVNTKKASDDITKKQKELAEKEAVSKAKQKEEQALAEKQKAAKQAAFDKEKKILDDSKAKERLDRNTLIAKQKQEEAERDKRDAQRESLKKEEKKKQQAVPMPYAVQPVAVAEPPVQAEPTETKPAPVQAEPVAAVPISAGKPQKVSANTGKSSMIAKLNEKKITDPVARAAIMAQASHESGGFTMLSENLNYKPSTLMSIFKKYFKTEDEAKKYARLGPAAIADRVYGGRMGNAAEGSGEGFKYRGRGFIQLTGKQNYTKFGYGSNPDEVASPDAAADTAIKYMLGYKGDWSNITAVTKYVNGGTIGLSDREKHFKEYLKDPSITQVGVAPTASVVPSSGGSGTQVAAATKSADIKPPKSDTKPVIVQTAIAQQSGKEKGAVLASAPNPTGVTNGYKGYFAVA